MGEYPSGQRGQTVNLLVLAFGGSNPSSPIFLDESNFSGTFCLRIVKMESMQNSEVECGLIQSEPKRLAAVLHKSLSGGSAANVTAVVVGGLRCLGFTEPVNDMNGVRHAGMMWNMPVLKAKTSGQLRKLLKQAHASGIETVAFTEEGRSLSNSFDTYCELVRSRTTEDLTIVGVGLFGKDAEIRELTRQFSLFS